MLVRCIARLVGCMGGSWGVGVYWRVGVRESIGYKGGRGLLCRCNTVAICDGLRRNICVNGTWDVCCTLMSNLATGWMVHRQTDAYGK